MTYSGFDVPTQTTVPLAISLDGQANDGTAGEGDNAIVEDVAVTAGPDATSVTNTLTGNAETNRLTGAAKSDVIDGGGGNDVLEGNGGDDDLRARDGFADRVTCGAGNDSARVDAFDQVGTGCETLDSAVTAYATEDAPPSIAFVAPGNGATLPTARPTDVTVTAGDDKGVAKVELIDDGEVVGTATSRRSPSRTSRAAGTWGRTSWRSAPPTPRARPPSRSAPCG